MTRKRAAWIAGLTAAAIAVVAVAAFVTVRSPWFREQVRRRIVTAVETATGGRAEIGSFAFDWRRLRAEIRDFTLHGTEAKDKPPLFHAASAAVGLKIVSVFKRKVDIRYLEVAEPSVGLIIFPDGHTNVPGPKVARTGRPDTLETVLDLAIARFSVQNGSIAVDSVAQAGGPVLGSQGGLPHFDIRGRNFRARLAYEQAGRRYRGDLAIQPLNLAIAGFTPTPVDITAALAVEKNRVVVESAQMATGNSRLRFSGAVEQLASPRGSFQYQAAVSQADVARFLHTKLLDKGTFEVKGDAAWAGGQDFSATGELHAYDMAYTDRYVRLRNFRAVGRVEAGPAGVDVTDLRASGYYAPPKNRIPVDLRVGRTLVRGPEIRFERVAAAALGGSFHGTALLERLDRVDVTGEIAGFQARRVVAVYSPEALPWDARVSGPIKLQASLQRQRDLHISAGLAISPEPGGAPVRGEITAAYDASSGVLDLGRSTLSLPSSRADFSGAIGRELRVHLQTQDLGDLLPAAGENAASFPVKLENGLAVFNGSVTGDIHSPRIAGQLSAARFVYSGKVFDSLSGDVTASQENVRLDRATLARGSLRAEFQAAVALKQWKAEPEGAIWVNATVRGAPLTELASLAGADSASGRLSGTVNATAQASGSVSKPLVQSEVEVVKGAFDGEPFDRFTAHLNYSGNSLSLASGQVDAGLKQVKLSATYRHAAGNFGAGQLQFQAVSNRMPLDRIQKLAEARPGLGGTVQATVGGIVEIRPRRDRERGLDVTELHADIAAQELRLSAQPLGSAHLTASTQGKTLRAHLDSDFAGSGVKGDGSWSLEGDYPGSANLTFSRLDLARLRDLASPPKSGAPSRFTGAAEGALRIDGPILRPEALKAELRMPAFELGPGPGARPGGKSTPFTLRNDGPIVATMANNVITVVSARLTGRATAVTVSGKAALNQKNPLDLRVNGNLDLGILQDFYPDITASGSVVANATVRGVLDDPQIGGRMEVRNANLSLADFPNGLSNANGIIVFSGDRATIQTFSGESGGGKIQLTGFAGYGSGLTLFRLHASAREVRVRYPEGVSTVANASLNLSGTSERSMLSGTITILRTGFNPQSDFGSMLAASAEPVRTPAAPSGPLGGMNFDVQIQTAPDIQVQSPLTQDIGIEANLRLRGTVSNPGLVGRVNITQGQLLFFGTKYNINQGSIAFYNQVKIEPIVNIDLETKAQGVDVTLTISGPLGKPNLTPRSDPPLQFNQIVALLATGQAPTSDPTLLDKQSTTPQSWQQMGASALLGQAIASPVTGRLQRFFGVSRLRIDPTLPGVEYNPQARITLQQQVTPAITFTYITVINSSNPQVVSMQWDFSKQWSVSAVREENGVFGLDFFVKRQFK